MAMLVSYLQYNLRSSQSFFSPSLSSLLLSCSFNIRTVSFGATYFIRLQSQLLIFLSTFFFFLPVLFFALLDPVRFFYIGSLVPLLTSIAISIYVIYCVIMQTRQEIKWNFIRVYLRFT